MNKLAQALTGITKLGINTSKLIYFIERHPVYLAIMQEIIQQIDAGKIIGYSLMVAFVILRWLRKASFPKSGRDCYSILMLPLYSLHTLNRNDFGNRLIIQLH